MKLLVIDGNSIVNRAFFGIKLLTTKDGRFTNAIYGFLNILLKLKETADPDAVVFAFDLKAPTFRHEMYDEYKAGRKGMPPELAEQMPVLKDLLQNPHAPGEGFEAAVLHGVVDQTADIGILRVGKELSEQVSQFQQGVDIIGIAQIVVL